MCRFLIKNRQVKLVTLMVLCFCLFGCGKKEQVETTKVDNHPDIMSEAAEETTLQEIIFPEHYTESYERVSFDCDLELPEDFTTLRSTQGMLNQKIFVDTNVVSELYLNETNIIETHNWPGYDQNPDGYSYILEDGTRVSTSDVFVYTRPDKNYYSQAQVHREEYLEQYGDSEVSFATGADIVEEMRSLLEQLGYPVDSLEFYYYPLRANDLKEAEQEYIDAGLILEGEEKAEWTEADDAYFIYAYQKYQELPILHESMSISYEFLKPTPDAAPVQAIYSARGLESLMVYNIYDITQTDDQIAYLEFDQIADCVAEKYNNILSDSVFVVSVAKLCQMVSYDKNQEQTIKPVWYFEVIENEMTRSYMLVDAVTGNELYLG